ncbi:MAG: hypothetical protein ACRC3H_21915 [Lachnospiraceae bacterium]
MIVISIEWAPIICGIISYLGMAAFEESQLLFTSSGNIFERNIYRNVFDWTMEQYDSIIYIVVLMIASALFVLAGQRMQRTVTKSNTENELNYAMRGF